MSDPANKRITRLAIISKDYTTYYVLNHTKVNDRPVAEIFYNKNLGRYEILDEQKRMIAEVSEDCPVVIDYQF